jgi:tetratricopeptide (TPR) repeat protein
MSVEAHRQAEQLLAQGERLEAEGRLDEARAIYLQAAQREAEVYDHLPADRTRTRGIIAVSVVSLYHRAGDSFEAIRHAHRYLAELGPPDFAQTQLFDLLLQARREEQLRAAGRTLSGRRIDVALRGLGLATGLAPLDTVVLKLQQFEKYILRVGEWAANRPFRAQGPAAPDVLQLINPLVSEPTIGSYRFEFQFEAPIQPALPLFDQERPLTPDRLADAFFEVIDATTNDTADRFTERIPDEQYRIVLSKLVRNLVPDGRELAEVEIRRVRPGDVRTAVLKPELRKVISARLPSRPPSAKSEEVRPGVLRALHLDEGWIMLAEDAKHRKYNIAEGRIFDDVVGPFVNRRVRVEGYRSRRRFLVTDIQLDTDEPAAEVASPE